MYFSLFFILSVQPVEEFRLTMSGFLPNMTLENQYHTLAEVQIYGSIANGYYVRSLHSIVVEGESAMNVDGPQIDISSNSSTFPNFSSRGYAQLSFNSSERASVQWILPSLPRTTTYRFFVRYCNLGGSRRLVGTLSQGEIMWNTRITFVQNDSCLHPQYAVLQDSMHPQSKIPANFSLNVRDPVTILLGFSSTNILLDAIIALPEEFFNPSNLSNIDHLRFMQECITSDGNFR